MNLILQPNSVLDCHKAFVKAAHEIGCNPIVLHGLKHVYDESWLEKIDQSVPTVCFGNIPFIRNIQKRTQLDPGGIVNWENFQYSTYAYHIPNLINHNYILVPYGTLVKNFAFYADKVGHNGKLFVRSNDGMKSWTGGVFGYKDLEFYNNTNPRLLLVCSRPYNFKNDVNEYRFWVTSSKQILTSARYISGTNCEIENALQEYVQEWLNKLDWFPDDIFTVDVLHDETGQIWGIVEINSLSCSGIYGANVKNLLSGVRYIYDFK